MVVSPRTIICYKTNLLLINLKAPDEKDYYESFKAEKVS